MILFAAAIAELLAFHLPACGGYVVDATVAERVSDAALVQGAAGHATAPEAIDTVMAVKGWRLIWATPNDSEPGIFFFRTADAQPSFIDVWGGVTADRDAAARWAADRVGVPAALAQCFASRLVDYGP